MAFVVILLVCVLISTVPFVIFVLKNYEKSNELTVIEMMHYEKIVADKYSELIKLGSCDNIAKALKLSIKEVAQVELPNRESILCQPQSSEYNGTIKHAKSDVYLRNFRCYHEIVHYVMDVGKNNIVKKVYGKDKRGETKSHKEQIINYIAAAIAIPRNDLLHELEKHQGEHYTEDFIKELQKRYGQPIDTIERRINEVILLANR